MQANHLIYNGDGTSVLVSVLFYIGLITLSNLQYSTTGLIKITSEKLLLTNNKFIKARMKLSVEIWQINKTTLTHSLLMETKQSSL